MIFSIFYSIIFIFILSNKPNQETIFNAFIVNNFDTSGKATFLGPLFIQGSMGISNSTFLNDNIFFSNNTQQIILNSKNITIGGLQEYSIGNNFLILEDNKLYILKNDLGIKEKLDAPYQTVYVNNIISIGDETLQIANTSSNYFQIGSESKLSDISLYGDAIIFLGTISTPNSIPLNITGDLNSVYNLNITSDLNIFNDVTTKNLNINNSVEITTPIQFFNTQINGITNLNNNTNITIVVNNGVLDFNNQDIKIFGLPEYTTTTSKELTLLVLDRNNNLYKNDLQQASTINAIDTNLVLWGEDTITVGDENHFTQMNADSIILDTVLIKKNTDEMIFNAPVITISNNTEISQLIFNNNVMINNITEIENLFATSNNTEIARLNQINKTNNTILNSNQIIFFNSNAMENYLGTRLVIDANNIIGIEGSQSKYKKTKLLQTQMFGNIKYIFSKLQNLKDIASHFDTLSNKQQNNLQEEIVNQINKILEEGNLH